MAERPGTPRKYKTLSARSMVTVSTGTGTSFDVPPSRAAAVQATIAGSTKVVVRIQGSVNGTQWVSLGAANSTLTNGAIAGATSLAPFTYVRANLISRTTTFGSTAAETLTGVWVTTY